MTVEEVREKLRSESKNQIKNGYTILDSHGDETYGLNFTTIQQIARGMPKDASLADELYAANNHDLKVFATLIDDPESYTRDELERRAAQLYPSPFAEKFCQHVMARSSYAVDFINTWTQCGKGEYLCYAYHTLSEVARQKNRLSDEFYANHLEAIASHIDEAPELVREAMIHALSNIATRDEKLRKKSEEIAARISGLTLPKSAIQNGKAKGLKSATSVH